MEKPNTAEEESIPVQGKKDAPPVLNAGPPQKKVAAVKEGAPLFSCGLCDAELVHKLAQVLLMGLSAACVDNTTGDLFKTPATVAVDMRREMVDYVTQRSETFVAETVIEEGNEDAEVLDNPTEIVSLFLDDFASSKRNLLGRVSNWLISERREDKIDEFVQEMEANGFWLVERRESVAEILLKNVDYKCSYHCDVKCENMGDLVDHKDECGFRVLSCKSEGCRASFCAKHLDKHESVCPFKLLQCEQKCPEIIMRCEMDKHCLTVCPMKLTNCPFHQVGCQAGIPRCTVEQHCSEALCEHVLQVLKTIHTGETEEHLRQRMEEMAKLPGFSQMAGALSVRNLTWEVKDLETELKTQEAQKAEENQKTSEDGDIEEEKEKTGEIGKDNQKTQEEDEIGEENQKTREMEIGKENQKTQENEIGKENEKTQEEDIAKEKEKTQESEIARGNQETRGEENGKENQKKAQEDETGSENEKTREEEIGKENQMTHENGTGKEDQKKTQENETGKENQKKTQENETGKENQKKTQENETGNENQKAQEDETGRGNQEKQENEIGMQILETQENEREKENQKTQEKETGMENRETQENEREKEIQMN